MAFLLFATADPTAIAFAVTFWWPRDVPGHAGARGRPGGVDELAGELALTWRSVAVGLGSRRVHDGWHSLPLQRFGANAGVPLTAATGCDGLSAFPLLLRLLRLCLPAPAACCCLQGIAIVLWSCASTRQAPPRPLTDRLVDRYLPLFRKRLVSEGAYDSSDSSQ